MDRFAQLIARRGAPGRGGLGRRHRGRKRDRVGASIATGIGGLRSFQDCYDTLIGARPGPRQPVRDPLHHPEHGRRLGLDGARHARPAARPQCTACAASNMAIGDGLDDDPARPRRRDVLRRHRGRRSTRSASPASARCARSRGGTTTRAGEPAVRRRTRRLRHGRGRRGASCSRSSSTRRRAARRSTPRLLGYGAVVGREARDRARSDRREPGARDEDGVRATPASIRRDRLRQRARDVDAARRRGARRA